jgi:SlyX protein
MKETIKDLEIRIIELETKYSHQDDLVGQLNLLVASQSNAIDRMKEEIQQLKDSDTKSQSGPVNLEDEVPPHY